MDLNSLANAAFFPLIFKYLQEEIAGFQAGMLGRFSSTLGIVALSILTIWIFFQGWRVMSGRSREPLMGLVGDALKAMLIIGFATGFSGNSVDIYNGLTAGLGKKIYAAVSGNGVEDKSDEDYLTDIYDSINESLVVTSVAMGAVSAVGNVDSSTDQQNNSDTTLMSVIVLAGTSGPALTGAAMVLMYQVGMALFVGFGPFFIICLLFDSTKSLFSRWLLYGAGMLFSLSVLYVLATLAMKLMLVVAGVMWMNQALQLGNPGGLRETAIQTGGLGLILTTMLITAPPMAASFFQGMLGNFNPYSVINMRGPQSGHPGPNGEPAGSRSMYMPGQQAGNDARNKVGSGIPGGLVTGSTNQSPAVAPGQMGVADQRSSSNLASGQITGATSQTAGYSSGSAATQSFANLNRVGSNSSLPENNSIPKL